MLLLLVLLLLLLLILLLVLWLRRDEQGQCFGQFLQGRVLVRPGCFGIGLVAGKLFLGELHLGLALGDERRRLGQFLCDLGHLLLLIKVLRRLSGRSGRVLLCLLLQSFGNLAREIAQFRLARGQGAELFRQFLFVFGKCHRLLGFVVQLSLTLSGFAKVFYDGEEQTAQRLQVLLCLTGCGLCRLSWIFLCRFDFGVVLLNLRLG